MGSSGFLEYDVNSENIFKCFNISSFFISSIGIICSVVLFLGILLNSSVKHSLTFDRSGCFDTNSSIARISKYLSKICSLDESSISKMYTLCFLLF